MTEQDSPPLEIETGAAPVFSVIWLHGLGADGRDFEQLPKMLDLPPGLPLRFILPDAPMRPITLNGGMVMRGWYDLTGMEAVKQEDAAGLAEAAATVESLVQKEVGRGVTRSHIVVGGFSQGGAVALHFGLRCNEPLAGIVGLSTYLPLSAQLTSHSHAQARNIPIFLLMDRSIQCWHCRWVRPVTRHWRTAALMSPGRPMPCSTTSRRRSSWICRPG